MSMSQIFKGTLAFVMAIGLVYLILVTINVWVSVLIAILVASAVRPAILRLARWRIPKGIAVFIVYGGIALVTIILLVGVLPPVINQFAGYIQNEDRLANRIIAAQSWIQSTVSQITGSDFELGIPADEIRAAITDIVNNFRVTAPSLIDDVTGFLGEFILIVVMGLYWITSRERAENFLVELAPLSRRGQVRLILEEIETGLGAYVRGIVLVSLIVGLLSFLILVLLRIPNAASLSFFYAVATAIPIIGGFIGVAVATFLALLTSPLNAVVVLLVTVFLQQVENYYLTPRVMSEGTDFDPLLIIVFVAIGFQLNGIVGGLISIPVAGTVSILLKHFVFEPQKATAAPVRVDGGILLQPAVEDKDTADN
jgi:predicted PurR-regulated permease PerM